jgi:hypothetical protein
MRGSAVAPWKLAAVEDEEEFLGIDAELDEDDEFDDPEGDDEDDFDDDDLDDEDDDEDDLDDDLDDDLIDLDDEFDTGDADDRPHPGRFEE